MEGLLVGWVEISNYLEVSHKTARRYEKHKGLPIIRKTNKGVVRAFEQDLDEWMRDNKKSA